MKATAAEPLRRDGFGEYKLVPESLDDLWHLSHLISWGDTVFAVTLRTVDGPNDKLRAEKLEKRPVRIGVKCEKVEFLPAVGRLRVFGVIVFGPDTGQHHTLNVETGYEISVVHQWRQVDLERLERAVAASVHGVVHIVAVEDGEAEVYRVRQYGPERVVTLTIGSGKTAEIDSRQSLFEELLRALAMVTGPVVVAGPGFVKEDFVKFARSSAPEIAERMLLADTRRSGYGAVQEAIGNGVLTRIAEDLQLAREVQVMDEVFLRIGQNGAVAYGPAEVREAIDYGAAETVIVADALVRENRTSKMIEDAERLGAGVVVLSTEFEPGKRLAGLGGVAALLRYKIAT
ncbi:MAG TPA: mRNA surveillance protein pelota [Methanocorpusculum sp.]|nr:mRNA surveillance protein pelota [Methanocorpusculum sp.]HJK21557.1 mRNA surveillance protein pelota [Methanocorpusculum sp.]HJK25818.1 mRNA surveillance protein pelota [Methanocorpusculum sp.]HJK26007.1 mRNA surveillance protein pelota [Methanocorpusculum sp.]HJK28552.1 mRNA surveillance protein pelota [Methanocorpusculum sp.]